MIQGSFKTGTFSHDRACDVYCSAKQVITFSNVCVCDHVLLLCNTHTFVLSLILIQIRLNMVNLE